MKKSGPNSWKKRGLMLWVVAVLGVRCGVELGDPSRQVGASHVSGRLEVYFSPENAKRGSEEASIVEAIVAHIDGATSSIYMAMFSLTHPRIIEALLAAEGRGVAIYIMVHRSNAGGEKMKALSEVVEEVYLGPKGGTFHHKYAVFDEKRLITGSANWSHNGNKVNRDHIVCVDDEATALRYVREWKRCQGCEGVIRYRDRVAK